MNELKQSEKWNLAISIVAESILRPDTQLRQDAYEQECFHELMSVREDILNHLETLRK